MRNEQDVMGIVTGYCRDIERGKIPSCLYVRKAVSRFLKMLECPPAGYRADWQALTNIINFAEELYIPDIGGLLKLLPWQLFCYAGIYLFVSQENPRLFLTQLAYIEVARKNSKTTSILFPSILYNFLATESAESYFFSGDEAQSRKAFEDLKGIVQNTESLNAVCECWSEAIVYKNSKIGFFSSNTKKLDSYKNSFAVLDEYHEYYTDKPLQASRQGMRARQNGGQVLIITTAGIDVTLPCYYESCEAKKMLEGVNKNDPSYFALIYTIDKTDDWKDSANLDKSNPSIDAITNRKMLEQDLERAINRPSTQANFLAKTYNVWVNEQGSSWIASDVWFKQPQAASDYTEKEVCAAIDLSDVKDLTVLTLYWEDAGLYHALHKVYIPEDTLADRILRENTGYASWVEQGLITVIPGATIDYGFLKKDLQDLSERCTIKKIAYDPWHSRALIADLEKELPASIELIEFKQNIASFSEPTKLFEKAIYDKKIVDPNPVMLWNLGNVVVKPDANGNIKPLKRMQGSKIDMVITSIMAHFLLAHSEEGAEQYGFDTLMTSLF